jgi:hypothetical protein
MHYMRESNLHLWDDRRHSHASAEQDEMNLGF